LVHGATGGRVVRTSFGSPPGPPFAAAKTEHAEIAMYEGLITKAEAMGADDIVALLEENLKQEKHTLEEVQQAAEKLAKELATQTA
jgi:ferritin-like metal-binding protein YciE